jgi:hypothetical protein
MADSFRAIIDNSPHGLPHAAPYYRVFPREPSPAGHMIIAAKQISLLQNPTLRSVLNEIAKTASAGATIMIVCHAPLSGSGLLIPLDTGGRQTSGDALNVVMNVAKVDSAAGPIRQMKEKTQDDKLNKRDAFVNIIRDLDPPIFVQGDVTLQQAREALDGWLQGQGARVKLSVQQLRALISAMDKIRTLKLDRIEFRACDAGKDPSVMLTMKKFFGCNKLLAPRLETFFLEPITLEGIPPVIFPTPKGTAANPGVLSSPHGHAARPGPLPDPPGTSPRTGQLWVPTRWPQESTLISSSGFLPVGAKGRLLTADTSIFLLAVGEMPPAKGETRSFRYRGAGVTEGSRAHGKVSPNSKIISEILNKFVLPGTIYPDRKFARGRFPVAGFWNPDDSTLPPFVLPNEDLYLRSIAQV